MFHILYSFIHHPTLLMLFYSGHISLLYGHTLPDIITVTCQISHSQQLPILILFILHLTKSPLESLILILESKISGFICVLVESKYILTYSFQSEIHLNHLQSFILCSH